jgi:DNA primase
MTGRIPKHFIDELLARTDIIDVIDARVPLKRAGSNHVACCPFHTEKSPSFTVSQSKQFYHCFGCGVHGTAIGFLMEYDRLSFPESVEALAHLAGMEVPKEAVAAVSKSEEFAPLHELLVNVADYYRQQLKKNPAAIDYLKNRGLSGETAKTFGIGFAPAGWDNVLSTFGKTENDKQKLSRTGLLIEKDGGGFYDRFRNRIMFPIRNRRGNVIGFGGRCIDPNDTPKYLNSPETVLFHKGRELYGLYEMQQHRPKTTATLVVEGYMDVVMLAEHGIHNAVATLGTATTVDHLQTLFKLGGETVFCFDGDNAGKQAAWRALETALPVLSERHPLRFLFLPDGEDPDSLVQREGQQAFNTRMRDAKPLAEYLVDHLTGIFDTRTLDGRAQLAEAAKPLLKKMQTGVLRELLINRIAELVGVMPDRLLTSELAPHSRQTATSRPGPAMPRRGVLEKTDIRVAIALLLNEPALALDCEPAALTRLAKLQNPGVPLLLDVLELIRTEPRINAAAIFERYRDTENAAVLSKLAAYEFPNPDENPELLNRTFKDAFRQLLRKADEQRYAELLQKSGAGGLSPEEKLELQRFGRD